MRRRGQRDRRAYGRSSADLRVPSPSKRAARSTDECAYSEQTTNAGLGRLTRRCERQRIVRETEGRVLMRSGQSREEGRDLECEPAEGHCAPRVSVKAGGRREPDEDQTELTDRRDQLGADPPAPPRCWRKYAKKRGGYDSGSSQARWISSRFCNKSATAPRVRRRRRQAFGKSPGSTCASARKSPTARYARKPIERSGAVFEEATCAASRYAASRYACSKHLRLRQPGTARLRKRPSPCVLPCASWWRVGVTATSGQPLPQGRVRVRMSSRFGARV